jgi:hypothetical protein
MLRATWMPLRLTSWRRLLCLRRTSGLRWTAKTTGGHRLTQYMVRRLRWTWNRAPTSRLSRVLAQIGSQLSVAGCRCPGLGPPQIRPDGRADICALARDPGLRAHRRSVPSASPAAGHQAGRTTQSERRASQRARRLISGHIRGADARLTDTSALRPSSPAGVPRRAAGGGREESAAGRPQSCSCSSNRRSVAWRLPRPMLTHHQTDERTTWRSWSDAGDWHSRQQGTEMPEQV